MSFAAHAISTSPTALNPATSHNDVVATSPVPIALNINNVPNINLANVIMCVALLLV